MLTQKISFLLLLMCVATIFLAGPAVACGKDSAWTGIEERKVKNFIAAVQEQFNKAMQLEGTSQGGEEIQKLKDMLDSANGFEAEINQARITNDREAKKNYQKYARKLKKISAEIGKEFSPDVSVVEAAIDKLEDKLDQEFADLKMAGDPGYAAQQERLAELESSISAAGLAMAGALSVAINSEAQETMEQSYAGLADRLTKMKDRVSAMQDKQ